MPPKIKQNSWICFKDLKHAALLRLLEVSSTSPVRADTDSVFSPLESNLWLEKSMVPSSLVLRVGCSCSSSLVLHRQTNVSSGWRNLCHFHVAESISQPATAADELQPSERLDGLGWNRQGKKRQTKKKSSIRRMQSQTGLPWQASDVTAAAQLASVFAANPSTNTLHLAPIGCTLAGEGCHSCPYMGTRELLTVLQFTIAACSQLWRVFLNVQRI